MEKITFEELEKAFWKYNESHNNGEDGTYITGVIVYKSSNWDKEYTEEQRSYRTASNNRAFQAGKIANSYFGNCLDGTDDGVRLDWYNWDVEYCYLDEKETFWKITWESKDGIVGKGKPPLRTYANKDKERVEERRNNLLKDGYKVSEIEMA